eukprot:Unigene3433_Nuclearia_a/m.10518 Unigene3433_Nuclearia_a/g.10518  ORF Unigene3433_Nuclearia_a/g.10518 Unigene3433_Nuclearia_a/m.10518 type:complete len:480 (-) Unigene3433_Nuclearia_a:17-1456(-)
MAAHDLTPTLARSLDIQLTLPLLDFLEDKQVYRVKDILESKISLLQRTNLVDFEISEYKKLHGTDATPPELLSKRERVVARLVELKDGSRALLDLFQDQKVLDQMGKDKQNNFRFLQENYGIKAEDIAILHDYAKFLYNCGNSAAASETLYQFLLLTTDPDKMLSALWGKLATEILVQNWDDAVEDLGSLRLAIDSRQTVVPPLTTLQQRSWLLTWSLFVHFNHAKGRESLVDMFLHPNHKQTIQTTCPHLLRYLAAAVIMTKRRKDILRELVAMIQQESHTYRDPIVDFVQCLYIDFNFDAAQQKLRECSEVFSMDFFLEPFLDEFIDNARLFIFETYCKIHQKIDISMLADKLTMPQDEAEKWIVNLIRNAQLDAKIDTATNSVIMGQHSQSIYQQVIEKTKNLSFRTQVLINHIEKREAARAQSGGQSGGGYHAGTGGGGSGGYKGRGDGRRDNRRDDRRGTDKMSSSKGQPQPVA